MPLYVPEQVINPPAEIKEGLGADYLEGEISISI